MIPDAQTLQHRMMYNDLNVGVLRNFWMKVFHCPAPPDQQFSLWLSLFHFSVVIYGLQEASGKAAKERGEFSQDRAIRFASSVMSRRATFLRNKINQKAQEQNGNLN